MVEFVEPGGVLLQGARGTVTESLKNKLDYNTFILFFSALCRKLHF